jgi:hypothetical protein
LGCTELRPIWRNTYQGTGITDDGAVSATSGRRYHWRSNVVGRTSGW